MIMRTEVDDKGVAFGRATAAVAEKLTALEYPITKKDLIEAIGGHTIKYDRETQAFLAEIVQGVPQIKFRDAQQAADAVDARWTRIAQALRDIERGANEIESRRR